MAQDRRSRLIAALMLCFLAGCGTGVRPSLPPQQASADNFFIQFDDGAATYYSMDLSNGDVTLKQRISIPGTGYAAGMDPLGRFVWVAQQDIAEHDTIITAPPTVNTFARTPDGLFSASDQRDYQPRIDQIAVERRGRWAYADGPGERRVFSISPVDGHLEGAGRVLPIKEFAAMLTLQPTKNIFYGYNIRNFLTPTQTTVFAAYAPDNDTGELKPLPNVATEVGYEIREMAFTSDGKYLVVLDFDPNHEVHLLAVDEDGGLREVDALTPASYLNGLVAHPKLPIVYHESLEGGGLPAFRVENGALTELPKIQVPGEPYILHISSNGRFLLVQSDQVYLITLNPQTGAATDIHPVSFSFGL
jgi:6-phosphogluconolactonase (cycloisomerase 2 family)